MDRKSPPNAPEQGLQSLQRDSPTSVAAIQEAPKPDIGDMQIPTAATAQPIPQPIPGYSPHGTGLAISSLAPSAVQATPDVVAVTAPPPPAALTHTAGSQGLLTDQYPPLPTTAPPEIDNPEGCGSAVPLSSPLPPGAALLTNLGAPPAFPSPVTTGGYIGDSHDSHPTAATEQQPEANTCIKTPAMPLIAQQQGTSPSKLPLPPPSAPGVAAPERKGPVATVRSSLSRFLKAAVNRLRGVAPGVGAAQRSGTGIGSLQGGGGGGGGGGRRSGGGRSGGGANFMHAAYGGETIRARTIRAILQQAALLPIPRRHELLALLEDREPDLALLFRGATPAVEEATVCTKAGVLAAELEKDMEAVPGLEAKLETLAQMVLESSQVAAPTPAPKNIQGPEVEAAAAAAIAADGVEAAAQPSEVLSVSVIPEYEQYDLDAQALRAVISIKAVTEVPQRARVALTCVLDRSGSMSGLPIRLVQRTCHFLIDQLNDDDYLGLISYSGNVRQDLPLIRMTAASRALAHAVVEELVASGSTALYDGLVAGVRQQMEAETQLGAGDGATSFSQSSVSQIVHSCFLFTDGQATDGPCHPTDIISGLRQLQAPTGQNVTVHTFGFGGGHSVELLQAVAEAQSGVYYYINSADDIASAFGDALGGLLAVVAKSVRVEVRTGPGVTLTAFRSGGRGIGAATPIGAGNPSTTSSSTAIIAGRSEANPQGTAAVPTGAVFNDMFAEETRECLLLLEIPAAATPGTAGNQTPSPAGSELVFVNLEYTDVISGSRVERTTELRVCRSADPRPVGQLPAEVVFVTAARFETLDAIESAQRAAARPGGDVKDAHRLLDTQLEKLESAPLKGPKLTALADQTRLAKSSLTAETRGDQRSVAAVAGTVQVLKQQRAAISTASTLRCYEQYDLKSKKTVRQNATKMVGSGLKWPPSK
ncbi:hypothetical protein VaNZ11_007506 [Volvox africanus]|uniref:VWFA domain-containing protein n=1 Tax=Volvox africanus TaxID=51714 RepID=A0ABQ5S324_9CHLO|nr:hypothetical protein VaNZ11_007506 [Volvox africanus]